MAYEVGMSAKNPRQSRGYDGGFVAGTSAPPKHNSGENAQPVWQRGGAYTSRAPCKTPKYSGKADWQVFHAQFELLSQAAVWSEDDKALQLALCLTDDARTTQHACYCSAQKNKIIMRLLLGLCRDVLGIANSPVSYALNFPSDAGGLGSPSVC